MDDAYTIDGITFSIKGELPGNTVMKEELWLVQAHLDELLVMVLQLTEED